MRLVDLYVIGSNVYVIGRVVDVIDRVGDGALCCRLLQCTRWNGGTMCLRINLIVRS